MGFFSWKTQDTKQSIPNVYSSKPYFTVFMHDEKGNVWTEDAYDGYGEFGSKDFYELLAEMNGVEHNFDLKGSDSEFYEKDPAYSEYMRSKGIGIAFSGKPYKSPNLTRTREWTWVDEVPDACEYQGYFYLLEGVYNNN